MNKLTKTIILLITTSLTSCSSWSNEDKKAYMAECHAEMTLGIGLILGAEKLSNKDLSKNMNLDPISSCNCSYDIAESMYSNYDEYKNDRSDKVNIFVAKSAKCTQK